MFSDARNAATVSATSASVCVSDSRPPMRGLKSTPLASAASRSLVTSACGVVFSSVKLHAYGSNDSGSMSRPSVFQNRWNPENVP